MPALRFNWSSQRTLDPSARSLSRSRGRVKCRWTWSLNVFVSRPSNQRIEHHYFEQFLKLGKGPEGEVTYGDRPDVVVVGRRKTGVEISNLYVSPGSDSSSEQAQSPLRASVVQQAQKLYTGAGGKKIEISVGFDPKHPIGNSRSVARPLAKFALTVPGSIKGLLKRASFAHIPEVDSVYHNPCEYPDPKWRVIQVYEVPLLSTQRVREIVDIKSKKIAQYQACDSYWLLLVVDSIDPAQEQELVWPEDEALGPTPFERVILYKPMERDVVDVPK